MKNNSTILISLGALACLAASVSMAHASGPQPGIGASTAAAAAAASAAASAAGASKSGSAIGHPAAAVTVAMAKPPVAQDLRSITIVAGQSEVLDTPRPVKRISVGLGDFAEASAVSPTEVLVNGKAPGQTSLILWDISGARHIVDLNIIPGGAAAVDRLQSVRDELKIELPGNMLTVSTANGSVFLRGTVDDLNASERAAQIAGTAGKVVNLLYVKVPPSEPQILLKVRFASIDRSKSKQLGMNLFSTGLGNTVGAVSTGQFSPPSIDTSGTAAIGSDLNLFAFFPGLNMGATIEAMEQKGLVEVLAQPNLLAMSGKKASFLAGGEYPYPVVQGTSSGSAAVTIMFKEYGVRLSFLPVITPRGTIRLQMFSEVSSLDFTNQVAVSGFQVPAIDTRDVKTEVELGDKQSFAVGGLLDNRETETFQKIPFLGDVPILGKFFQSISRSKTNTELIVIVTPEIVAPIQPGNSLPELKYPKPFLPFISGIPMHTPDSEPGPHPPVTPVMPVEKLVESMKAEKSTGSDSNTTSITIPGGAAAAGTDGPPPSSPQ